ncbi:hypothetical protein JNUCC64_25460 [Streptomyces sp. JNUCC 64]
MNRSVTRPERGTGGSSRRAMTADVSPPGDPLPHHGSVVPDRGGTLRS